MYRRGDLFTANAMKDLAHVRTWKTESAGKFNCASATPVDKALIEVANQLTLKLPTREIWISLIAMRQSTPLLAAGDADPDHQRHPVPPRICRYVISLCRSRKQDGDDNSSGGSPPEAFHEPAHTLSSAWFRSRNQKNSWRALSGEKTREEPCPYMVV